MSIYVDGDVSYFCENDYRVKVEMIIVTIDAAPVWICTESCVCFSDSSTVNLVKPGHGRVNIQNYTIHLI